MDPQETATIWAGVKDLWEQSLVKPTVFEREYKGLESVVDALKALSGREVWGKAVIAVAPKEGKPHL